MKYSKNNIKRWIPYEINKKNDNSLINLNIMNNIKCLYSNATNDNKSYILSLVAYDDLIPTLKNTGLKFTKKQFNAAKLKRINNNFTFKKYIRHVPESKKKLNEDERKVVIKYLDYFSRESCNDIKYLEKTKKFIYNQYAKNEKNRKITYNTFLKYCPKYYKIGKRRTDVYGICEIGKI